jgi:hypothetical protein
VHSDHAKHATQSSAMYGGAPGVVIRGLPPTPSRAVYVVVSHSALVYVLIAPGKTLGPDQRRALASLRFFTRQGTRCP